jgi:hypothetical protein
MAGHGASPLHTAVDTVIPLTSGVDKLRTVCGCLRRNAVRERFCKSSDSRGFAAGRLQRPHGPQLLPLPRDPLTLSVATPIGIAWYPNPRQIRMFMTSPLWLPPASSRANTSSGQTRPG